MQLTEARELTSRMSYKPGWTISGEGYSGCGGEVFYVNLRFRAPQSDAFYAPQYNRPVDVEREFAFDLDDYATADDFVAAVFQVILATEVHEASEFFALADDDAPQNLNKPFHAHTDKGMIALDGMEPLSLTKDVVDEYALDNARWREESKRQRAQQDRDEPGEVPDWLSGLAADVSATEVTVADGAVSVSHA